MNNSRGMGIFQATLFEKDVSMHIMMMMAHFIARLTSIWYRKYWMNCFSKGLLVSSLCRSVPSSSVTKYMSSKGLMKMSEREMMFS